MDTRLGRLRQRRLAFVLDIRACFLGIGQVYRCFKVVSLLRVSIHRKRRVQVSDGVGTAVTITTHVRISGIYLNSHTNGGHWGMRTQIFAYGVDVPSNRRTVQRPQIPIVSARCKALNDLAKLRSPDVWIWCSKPWSNSGLYCRRCPIRVLKHHGPRPSAGGVGIVVKLCMI